RIRRHHYYGSFVSPHAYCGQTGSGGVPEGQLQKGRFRLTIAGHPRRTPVNLPNHLLPTTVVGSYPQPEWLVDRAMLSKSVPRTRMHEMWRLPQEHLEEAQDDATVIAIRDMERAGIDVVTDGEIRRESYSNRFATALE